jgi:outer membrane protein
MSNFAKLGWVGTLSLLLGTGLGAQQRWNLQQCVEYATKNSIAIKQADNQIRLAELGLKQNVANRLPQVNASASGGIQFGRTIDPTTNSFDSENIGSNSISLSAGMPIYNGGQIKNSIRQSRLDMEAITYDAKTSANTIALSIAAGYLNVLLAEEQLAIARTQLDQSRLQLTQTEKLIEAGSRPRNERLDAQAQVALNEQSVVDAENQVIIRYLNLKQLMLLDPTQELLIDKPAITIPADANPDAFNLEEIYVGALGTQPQILAGQKRKESALLGVDLARANMLPSLSIFGNINSFASTRASNFGFRNQRISQTAFFNGQPVNFEIESQVPVILGKKAWIDQVSENFGQSLGVQLSIPIFNNNRNRINMDRAKVNAAGVDLNNEQAKQQLKTDIQTAIANARAARRSYLAAQASEAAARLAFENAQQRFEIGAANQLDFNTARNNLARAQTDLSRAKYQYIFNLKQVEFYQGRQLTLN